MIKKGKKQTFFEIYYVIVDLIFLNTLLIHTQPSMHNTSYYNFRFIFILGIIW